jgi:magnesium transporter
LRSRRQTEPGSRPGSIVVDPQAPAPTITAIQYNAGDFAETADVGLDRIAELLSDQHVTWVNIDGLGDATTIRTIGETFSIHRLVLEDIVNVHQRAKVDEFDEHLFIVARMVSFDDHLQTEQISLILGQNFVLTFQEHVGDCLEGVRNRLRKQIGRIRTVGADYLAYAIIDAVIDGYFPVLDQYSDRLDKLEEGLTSNRPGGVVRDIHRLRSEFYILRRAIWPHREMVNSLIRDMESRFDSETLMHLSSSFALFGNDIGIEKAARDNWNLNLLTFNSTGTEAARDGTYQFIRRLTTFVRSGFHRPQLCDLSADDDRLDSLGQASLCHRPDHLQRLGR